METNTKVIYECIKCNYRTTRKNDYEKHKTTSKHLRIMNINEISKTKHKCCCCNKEYKHQRSLIRHEKECIDTRLRRKRACSRLVYGK